MMWPTLGSRTAEEQNRTELTYLQDRLPYILSHEVRGKGKTEEKRWTDDIRDHCMGIGNSTQEASRVATDDADGGTLFAKWATRARGHRLRRHAVFRFISSFLLLLECFMF